MAETLENDDLIASLLAEPSPLETGGSGGRSFEADAFDDGDVEADDEENEPPLHASGRRPRRVMAEQPARASERSPMASRSQSNRYALAERDVLRPGDVIGGKYRVDRIVGRRGSAMVLQGTHLDLGQLVTIRHPPRDVSRRPNTIARFLRVARAACQIRSEHAARILDVGRLDTGVPFLVMEGLDGWNLEEVLRVRGPLPVEDAVDYVVQASEAIAEAHGLGLVHRSLSMWNLMLTRRPDGSAFIKVLEFGVPDVIQSVPFSEIAGTDVESSPFMSALRFLSPEQIRNADEVDARADIWALGAILHELLTGTPAFFGASPGALLAAVAADPPRPTGSLNNIPPEIDAAILRSLAKDRTARFQTIAEFVQALRSCAPPDSLRVVERISRMSLPSRPPPLVPPPLPGSVSPASRLRPPASVHPALRVAPLVQAQKTPVGTSSQWLAVALVGALIGAFLAIGTERFHIVREPAAAPVVEKATAAEATTKQAPPAVASPAAPQDTAPLAPKAVAPQAAAPPTAVAALPMMRPVARPQPAVASPSAAIAAAKSPAPPTGTSATSKNGASSSGAQASKDLFDDTR